MTVKVVFPVVGDYIEYSNMLKQASTPQAKRKYAYVRDKIWETMTTEAQWQAVEILNGQLEYKVLADE